MDRTSLRVFYDIAVALWGDENDTQLATELAKIVLHWQKEFADGEREERLCQDAYAEILAVAEVNKQWEDTGAAWELLRGVDEAFGVMAYAREGDGLLDIVSKVREAIERGYYKPLAAKAIVAYLDEIEGML